MNRLLRKELAENRWTPVWLGLLVGLLTVSLKFLLPGVENPSLMALCWGWICAGPLTVSGLVSREVGNETLSFLMSLPVSRSRVWWTKCAASLVLTGLSIAAISVCWWIAYSTVLGSLRAPMALLHLAGPLPGWALAGAAVTTVVAMSMSPLMDRALAATGASLLMALGIFAVLAGLSSDYHVVTVSDYFLNVVILAIVFVPAFCAASYWTFTRGESLRTRKRYLIWIAAFGLTLSVSAGLFLGAHARLAAFNPARSSLWSPMLSPDGHWMVAKAGALAPWVNEEAVRRQARTQKTWSNVDQAAISLPSYSVVRRVDGRGRHFALDAGDLTQGNTGVDDWSSDGQWALARQQPALFGLQPTYSQPREWALLNLHTGAVVRLPPPAGRNGPAYAAFSPDARWLMACYEDPPYFSQPGMMLLYDLHRAAGDGPLAPTGVRPTEGSAEPGSAYAGDAEIRVLPAGRWSNQATGASFCWGADSRYLYGREGDRLIALDFARISTSPNAIPLCQVSDQNSITLRPTADPHRAVVELDTYRVNDDGRTCVGRSLDVVDLAAATRAADIPPPVATGAAAQAYAPSGASAPAPPPDACQWVQRWRRTRLSADCTGWVWGTDPKGTCVLAVRDDDPAPSAPGSQPATPAVSEKPVAAPLGGDRVGQTRPTMQIRALDGSGSVWSIDFPRQWRRGKETLPVYVGERMPSGTHWIPNRGMFYLEDRQPGILLFDIPHRRMTRVTLHGTSPLGLTPEGRLVDYPVGKWGLDTPMRTEDLPGRRPTVLRAEEP